MIEIRIRTQVVVRIISLRTRCKCACCPNNKGTCCVRARRSNSVRSTNGKTAKAVGVLKKKTRPVFRPGRPGGLPTPETHRYGQIVTSAQRPLYGIFANNFFFFFSVTVNSRINFQSVSTDRRCSAASSTAKTDGGPDVCRWKVFGSPDYFHSNAD